MAEIAVAIDMDQGDCARAPRGDQCAKQDRAVAADDQRELALPKRTGDDLGKIEVEAADRRTITQPSARLRSVL
ncbi:hypothetical protein NKI96_09315 [Mesorhizobium sp. M0292]|uniref:hypothetical protein n=1 Tax=Mesorhizobium sp. M0292 TaxID=2956929 RepID=UPI003339D1FB